jgi:hypothetical protein
MINFVSSTPYKAKHTNTDHGKKRIITVDRARNSQKPNLRYGLDLLS